MKDIYTYEKIVNTILKIIIKTLNIDKLLVDSYCMMDYYSMAKMLEGSSDDIFVRDMYIDYVFQCLDGIIDEDADNFLALMYKI